MREIICSGDNCIQCALLEKETLIGWRHNVLLPIGMVANKAFF